AAVAIREEVHTRAVRRERRIEVVGLRIERHDVRRAPAVSRADALVDVPAAAAAGPADRAPQHALAVGTERDADFGFLGGDQIREPHLRRTAQPHGAGDHAFLHAASVTKSPGSAAALGTPLVFELLSILS